MTLYELSIILSGIFIIVAGGIGIVWFVTEAVLKAFKRAEGPVSVSSETRTQVWQGPTTMTTGFVSRGDSFYPYEQSIEIEEDQANDASYTEVLL